MVGWMEREVIFATRKHVMEAGKSRNVSNIKLRRNLPTGLRDRDADNWKMLMTCAEESIIWLSDFGDEKPHNKILLDENHIGGVW